MAAAAERAWAQAEAPAVESFTDADIPRLYGLLGWREVWTPEMRSQMATVFAGAARHGLDAAPVAQFGRDLDAVSDVALSKAALRYAQALAMGAANPDKLHPVFALRRNQVDLVEGLAEALSTGRLVEWFDSLAPSDDQYRALSEAYLQARAATPPHPARPAPPGPSIPPGGSDPRVPAIARLLVGQGYLARPPPGPKGKARSLLYEPPMVEAIEALQAGNGLPANGVVDEATLQVLNGGLRLRARTLAVNLERLRWLARDPPPNRIDVNIAAAELQVYQDGVAIARHKVVVGAPKHETPPLEASFSRLVVNPPWYVPASIARREILPKGRRYMARHGMVVREGRVIQKPGPDSALGQVKFDLVDDNAIYLHDTPLKKLFDRPGRHLSHGCVRVQDAVGLAEWLADAAGRLADLQEALASSATHTVDLGVEVSVRLVYLTAFADGEQVRLVPDAYGWDDGLAQALGLGLGGPRQSAEASPDVGP